MCLEARVVLKTLFVLYILCLWNKNKKYVHLLICFIIKKGTKKNLLIYWHASFINIHMHKNIHTFIFIISILECLHKSKSSTTSVKYVAFWQRTLIHMLSSTSWVVMHPLLLNQPCTEKIETRMSNFILSLYLSS